MRRGISSSCPTRRSFYFDDLRGEKYLRYVPNTSHSLDKTDALESLQAFYATIVKGTPRPQFTWTFERDGAIKVVTKDRPEEVLAVAGREPGRAQFPARRDRVRVHAARR